jgi:hypothetical protein
MNWNLGTSHQKFARRGGRSWEGQASSFLHSAVRMLGSATKVSVQKRWRLQYVYLRALGNGDALSCADAAQILARFLPIFL